MAITRAKKTLAISYARQRMLYGHTTYGRPSRFLDELPAELVKTNRKPKTAEPEFGYIPARSNMYGDFDSWVSQRPAAPKKKQSSSVIGSAGRSAVTYRKGDMVNHRAFGRGMVLSVLPMGNDALLEIAFDEIGTKKLMANTASAHMSKV